MTQIYTYSDARQNFATLLEQAVNYGEVRIRRKDGTLFVLKPMPPEGSPLDVDGLDLNLTPDEIVEFIHEGRRNLDFGDGTK